MNEANETKVETKKAAAIELTTVTPAAPPAVVTKEQTWGVADNIDPRDIQLPRIILMQASSKPVKKGEAKQGEWRESLDFSVIGDNSKPLELVVFGSFKTWKVREKTGDGPAAVFQNSRTIPYGPDNCDWQFQEVVNGITLVRSLMFNFFCLPCGPEIASNIPHVLYFKSTGIREARKLTTLFAKMASVGKPSASRVVELTQDLEEKGEYLWLANRVALGRESTPEEIAAAKYWHKKLGNMTVSVHETDDDVEGDVTPPAREAGSPPLSDDDVPF